LTILGIDLGASRLRLAVERGGAPVLVGRTGASPEPLRIVEQDPVRIISLKRLLDFDRDVRTPGAGEEKSLDCMARLLRERCREVPEVADARELCCVVGVPSAFSQRWRSALQTGIIRAGFPLVRLVDDVKAVLLASRPLVRGAERVLVFSWGASCLSVGVFHLGGRAVEVCGQSGDGNLGGDDIDSAIARLVEHELFERCGPIWCKGRLNGYRLAERAEEAKRSLLAGKAAPINLKGLLTSDPGMRDSPLVLQPDVALKPLEDMIARAMDHASAALRGAGNPRLDVVLINGGMTRLARVRETLEKRLSVAVRETDEGAVALGAVVYGRMLPPSELRREEAAPAPVVERTPRARTSPQGAAGAKPTPLPAEPVTGGFAADVRHLLREAERREAAGELEEAVEVLNELFRRINTYSNAFYLRLASRHERAGELEKAWQLLNLAYERDTSNVPVGTELARLSLEQGARAYNAACQGANRRKTDPAKLKAALDLANRGTKVLNSLPAGSRQRERLRAKLLHLKGLCHCQRGELDDALKAVEDACQLDPTATHYVEDLARIRDLLRQMPTKPPAKRTKRPKSRASAKTTQRGRTGRNDPCPCGSGEKYKNCCGRRH